MKRAFFLVFVLISTLVMLTLVAVAATRHEPLSPSGAMVDVWVTTGDESKKLQQQSSIQFSPGSGNNEHQITVDAMTRYQEMDGFGAALTDSAAWVITNTQEATQTMLMTALFSATTGIGISYLRLPMGASEFVQDDWYTYDDMPPGMTDPGLISFTIDHDRQYIIPILHRAKEMNPQLRVMASPWSAPAWIKMPETLTGGSLELENYQVYARYFVSFTLSYSEAGIPIHAVSIQNEPYYTSTNYPTMWMEPEDQADFIENHIGPQFDQHGINTKILIWDHNWDNAEYPLTVLSDEGAKPFIAGTAWHCYEGDPSAQMIVHDAHPDKDTYFTECSGSQGASQGFGNDLVWGFHKVAMGATRNWGTTVLYWNLVLDDQDGSGPHKGGCADCRGLVTVYPNERIEYKVEYYIVGHLSKFVDPGAHRIESSYFEGQLESVAFQNLDDSIVLVVLNPTANTTSFDVRWSEHHFAYDDLPPQSVVTFKWNAHWVYLPLVLKTYPL